MEIQDIIQHLEDIAPPHNAQDWDNVGLQIGDKRAKIDCLIVALDISDSVVNQAIENGAQLIIAHHPLIFTPIKNLTWQDPLANLIRKIINADLNIYIAHTNFDVSPFGVSNLLAQMLELSECVPLSPVMNKIYKLVVFVPVDYADRVRNALGAAGAGDVGEIGNYSECSFQAQGKGFFRSAESAHPFIGKAGELTFTDEIRLETIVPHKRLSQVLKAMRQTHPYQEIAYDLYPLQQESEKNGLGAVGNLPQKLSLAQLAQKISQTFNLKGLRVVGDSNREIKKAAICGGSGGDLIAEAKHKGADVLISGDFKYHQARSAEMEGIALIDMGHFESEYPAMEKLARNLEDFFQKDNKPVKVIMSEKEIGPFNYM